MSADINYLLGRLLSLINLDELLTVISVAMIIAGSLPLILPHARQQLWAAIKRYAEGRSLQTFALVPLGLLLWYVK